jgi:hypothetical protein
MKFMLPNTKPRNPLVSLARLRRAGLHRKSSKAARLAARRALCRTLAEGVGRDP